MTNQQILIDKTFPLIDTPATSNNVIYHLFSYYHLFDPPTPKFHLAAASNGDIDIADMQKISIGDC